MAGKEIDHILGAQRAVSLPFVGAGVAAAATGVAGMDQGMWVQITGLPNGPKDNVTCYIRWDNSTADGWDNSGPATDGVGSFTHLVTEGHTYLDVQCNNNGT